MSPRSPRLPRFNLRLVCRREQWVLTAQGWLLAIVTLLTILFGGLANLEPFLAVNTPIPAEVLVVEGWIADENVKQAIEEFNAHPYQKLVTTGGPLQVGFYLAEYKTFANLCAATLLKLDFDADRLVAVPADFVVKDRTYASAIAFKQWLTRSGFAVRAVNIFTVGAHARRTQLLYQKALGPDVQVGVLSAPDLDYNARRWWAASAGVRTVLSEAIAYLYAVMFSIL